MAPPKGGRFDDALRMLTELGVGGVQALSCERVSRLPDPARGRRVVAEAIKQCRRAWLPQVANVSDFSPLARDGGRLILLDADGEAVDDFALQRTTLIAGPEGGFTPTEREQLIALGARPTRIATPVLRIETAVVAAAAVWIHAWERQV